MSHWLRAGKITAFIALLALAMAGGSSAHPHIMIAAEVSFEIREGALVAIRQRWTFDEAHRRSTFDEFDKNRNGILEPHEVQAFRALAVSTMDRFSNFTNIEFGGAKVRTKKVVFTKLDMAPARPVIEFKLSLVEPLLLSQPVFIEVYDPTYYSAFSIPTAAGLKIESETGPACAATLTAPPKDGEQLKAHRAFVSAFGPMAAILVKPQAITLTCGAPQPALAVSGDGAPAIKSEGR